MTKNDIIKYQSIVNRPLILDGLMGSLVQMSFERSRSELWSSCTNITNPEQVINLHNNYISSGADIITSNTFRTNPTSFSKVDLNITNYEFVNRSVNLAKIACKGRNNLFVAASNPPAEDSYQFERMLSDKQIEYNHRDHIDMLWDSGCDFILNETQNHFDEIKIICQHCSKNKIPLIISLFITPELNIMSGESFEEIFNFIILHSPIAIGINCVYPKIYNLLSSSISFNFKWGYYLNCGSGHYNDTDIHEGISPAEYGNIVKESIGLNPFFVGSCCGSTPLHTNAIKDAIYAEKNN